MSADARGQVNQCLYHARLHLDHAASHAGDAAFAQSRLRSDLHAAVLELYRAMVFLAMELDVLPATAADLPLASAAQLQQRLAAAQASSPSAALGEWLRRLHLPAYRQLCAAYESLWRCLPRVESQSPAATDDNLLKIKEIDNELALPDCQQWLAAVRELVDACRAAEAEF